MHDASQVGKRIMTAKNRITINLETEEYAALQEVARVNERSMAWICRKAVRQLIGANEIDLVKNAEEKSLSLIHI